MRSEPSSRTAKPELTGKVYLIGAGPGDPKLLTIRGLELLSTADVIVYDRLASPRILEKAKADAELIFVGKSRGSHSYPQEKINKLLIKLAKSGKMIARLKGGDPFVFGRGGEEALALVQAGISFEVVPGVSAGVAVPAYAGIPVTHRGLATSVAFITGHEDPSKSDLGIKWSRVAKSADTLVFFMGMYNLELIVAKLIKYGRAASDPVAIIRWGTTASQVTVKGKLNNIVGRVARARLKPPCIIVVGKVVGLSDKLKWFENKPLAGKTIVITRSRDQASEFAEKLEALGAETIIFPTIKIVELEDKRSLDSVLKKISVGVKTSSGVYDWVIFTSVNAVDHFLGRYFKLGYDIRDLAGIKIAAVGKATAAALSQRHLNVDMIAKDYRQEGLVAAFKRLSGKGAGIGRVLIPRAKEARTLLETELSDLGANVTVLPCYENVLDRSSAKDVQKALSSGAVSMVTFTSSSTVINFNKIIPTSADIITKNDILVGCIGPVTADTATQLGLNVDVMPSEYTINALVESISNFYKGRSLQK